MTPEGGREIEPMARSTERRSRAIAAAGQVAEWSPVDEPWGKIGLALLLGGGGYWLHGHFARLEAVGGSTRMNWLIALIYTIGGKSAVFGVLAAMGAAIMVWGLLQWADKK
jgi:hypothetical protein